MPTALKPIELTEGQFREVVKCRNSFYYWLKTYTTVVEVGKGTPQRVAWNLWPSEITLVDTLLAGKWPIGPKARQLGVTTINLYFGLWYIQFHPLSQGVVISEKEQKAFELLDWIRAIAQTQPEWMQQPRTKDSASILQFESEAQIMALVGNEGAGRMKALNWAFIDEASYVPSLEAILRGVEPAAESARGIVSVCSTTKREGTNPVSYEEFRNECYAAAEGKSKFTLCFLPWNMRPDRTQEWYEREAAAHAHIPGYMQREYPGTMEEAFGTVGGSVFPTLRKETHWKHFDPPPGAEFYRAIDFGNTADHPFVCLWLWNDASAAPTLTFESDESAEIVIASEQAQVKYVNGTEQLLSYRRNPKTGRLNKLHDDVADALRYAVTMFRLRGHVHVYRCLFIRCDTDLQVNPLRMFEGIMELSGYECRDPLAGTWTRGPNAESYEATVCDRSGTGWIRVLIEKGGIMGFGIDAVAYEKPDTFTRDEREQGIVWLNAMIIGGTTFETSEHKTRRQANLEELTSGERPLLFEEKLLLFRMGLSESTGRKTIWGYEPTENAHAR